MGYRNFDDTPSMHSQSHPSGPPGTSTFDDVVYWSQKMTKQEIASVKHDPRVLGLKAFAMVCAEWRGLIQYINTRLAQIEWELEEPEYRKDASGLDASLQKLHPWRRSVPAYYQFVAETIDRVFPEGDGRGLNVLLPDFNIVLKKISALESRVERIVNVATAIINIDEARRSVEQNRNFGRLTYLAVIFVPASFVSSFFSMSPDVSALAQTFWIYATIAVPLTALALLVTLHFDKLQATWRAVRPVRDTSLNNDNPFQGRSKADETRSVLSYLLHGW